MLARLILAFLARMSAPVDAAAIAAALSAREIDVTNILNGTLIPQSLAESNGSDPVAYSITPAGADSLLTAPLQGDVSPELTYSINNTFAEESGNADATFLYDVRSDGFSSLDARDISYLLAEYGIGASVKTGDVNILSKCARLAKLADHLAARI